MYPDDTLVGFGREDGVESLLESFRENYLLADIWGWVLFNCFLDLLYPNINICPFSIVGELGEILLEKAIQVVGDRCVLTCFIHKIEYYIIMMGKLVKFN